MKLSIITVNLNNASGLAKTIASVVEQTFTRFDWIVIDGGSTDGSVEFIRQQSSVNLTSSSLERGPRGKCDNA